MQELNEIIKNCNHKGYWVAVSTISAQIGNKIFMIIPMYCKNCSAISIRKQDINLPIIQTKQDKITGSPKIELDQILKDKKLSK